MPIEDLIFDIGMNHGDDTAYYLTKNFRVVGVEANPVLAEECRSRFAEAISAGRLVVESVGIEEKPGIEKFYVNENDGWSAFGVEEGTRGGKFHVIDVPCITFADLLSKHGVPFYLKIDIERSDRHCLPALDPSDLPKYVSIEAHDLEYLLVLWRLGYRNFKVIDQMRHNSWLPNFTNENLILRVLKRARWYLDRVDTKVRRGRLAYTPGVSSGPFGEDTIGPWLPLEDVAYDWLHHHRGHHNRGSLDRNTWHDFHAKL
jgi:FkbM family methyltransferase